MLNSNPKFFDYNNFDITIINQYLGLFVIKNSNHLFIFENFYLGGHYYL
jgi:hypothetical protein